MGTNQPDAQAGTGGVGGSGGVGGNESDAGGTGGGMDAGGTSGSDAATWRDASIDDVDLTLGGFNQDLPAPSVDCLMRENLGLGCMAISLEYNGVAYELQCEDQNIIVAVGGDQYFGCKEPFALGGELDIRVTLARQLLSMPAVTFSVDTSGADAHARVFYPTRNFPTQLADTHDQNFRVAGISDVVQTGSGVFARSFWRIDGTFGLSLIPKSTCVPDTMGLGCDEIRMRGNFRVQPNEPAP